MKLYIKRKRTQVDAVAEYDEKTGRFTVLAGSVLSPDIAQSATFRGAKSIERARDGIVRECVLQKDVAFKSASTAANFVTGRSTNGMIAWQDSKGNTLKEIRSKMEANT